MAAHPTLMIGLTLVAAAIALERARSGDRETGAPAVVEASDATRSRGLDERLALNDATDPDDDRVPGR